jgi:preprotein translocase subunit SecD
MVNVHLRIVVITVLSACGFACANGPREVAEGVSVEFHAASSESFPGGLETFDEQGKRLFVDPVPRLTARDVRKVFLPLSGMSDGVMMDFTTEGSARLRRFTREQSSKRIAILVNGRVVSAPLVQGEIADSVYIGARSEDDALRLFHLLSEGDAAQRRRP